jgi:CheY-like chemotaxis protein
MEKMLQRIVGEDVELTLVTAAGASVIHADPGQVEQVLMNLVVNARDAMPTGGKLTITTDNATIDAATAQRQGGPAPGPYVTFAITDTGIGMDAETAGRIFEPFFTTKEPGRGTGLGLSTVYGIVQQSGGIVTVQSEPGRGTTFCVYLPRTEGSVDSALGMQAEPTSLHGTETVLLVEDEDPVRATMRAVLTRFGYNVLEAENGGEALLICEKQPAPIHLLIADVVMPRMSGRELAERLAPMRPEMKVLFVSGYGEHAAVARGALAPDAPLFRKPITPDALARKVREVLDAR